MPTAILTETDPAWLGWAKQYAKARDMPLTQIVAIPNGSTSDQAKNFVLKAIAAAGVTGTLIVSAGHGGSTDSVSGMFDLAPNRALRIGGHDVADTFVDVFYDVKMGSNPAVMSDKENDEKFNPGSKRLKNWAVYQEIGNKFKSVKPYKVVLLTCRVGNSIEFLRKVANDWRVVIHAYKRRAVVQQHKFPNTTKWTSFVYLEGNTPNINSLTADQIILLEEHLPYHPNEMARVGPPLP